MEASGPLSSIKILDFTHVLSGPIGFDTSETEALKNQEAIYGT